MSFLKPVSSYPLSPFQERISLLPVTCKITQAAFKKLAELKTFQLWMSMNLDKEKKIALFYVDKSFLLRLQCCYKPPSIPSFFDDLIEPVAPALCRGFDDECESLVLRTPGKWYSVSGERTVVCKPETTFENLNDIRTILIYSFGEQREEIPFTVRRSRESRLFMRDKLNLYIDFKDDLWRLESEFLISKLSFD